MGEHYVNGELDNQLEAPKYPQTEIALQLRLYGLDQMVVLYALNAHKRVLSSIRVIEIPKYAPRKWANPRRRPTSVKWFVACGVFVLGCWVAGELLN